MYMAWLRYQTPIPPGTNSCALLASKVTICRIYPVIEFPIHPFTHIIPISSKELNPLIHRPLSQLPPNKGCAIRQIQRQPGIIFSPQHGSFALHSAHTLSHTASVPCRASIQSHGAELVIPPILHGKPRGKPREGRKGGSVPARIR
jgi:hypothetical protein